MKRMTLALALAAVGVLTLGTGHAADCGDGGSPENWAGSCETGGNEVRCGPEERTPVAVATLGTIAVEACNDGSTVPVQGRVGVDDDCLCVYADGDADNPVQVQGWVRIDQRGVRLCNDPDQPSYNSGNC